MKLIKRLFKLAAAILAVAFILDLIVLAGGGLHMKHADKVLADPDRYRSDVIIVLGAGVYSTGEPTPILRDRLDRGIQLYRAGLAPKLLLSGDNGTYTYDEVSVMRNYCLDQGVPAVDIFLDHAGFSTYESMHRAKSVFGAESAIVVTQVYHEFRSIYIGRRMGMDVVGVPAVRKKYSGGCYRELREILARDKDMVKCLYKPDPTYLGDPIDLSGSGVVSW